MKKLDLRNVTLVIADGHNPKAKVKELSEYIESNIDFYDTKLFLSGLNTIRAYNLLIVKELINHIESEYVMICQLDGYPVNFNAWEDEFLEYDYIGAPWYAQAWSYDMSVGNGGFSIRSKEFLKQSSKLNYDGVKAEDLFLCRHRKKLLESQGIRFAPHGVAYRFSVEDLPYKEQFGFHGKKTIEITKYSRKRWGVDYNDEFKARN